MKMPLATVPEFVAQQGVGRCQRSDHRQHLAARPMQRTGAALLSTNVTNCGPM